MNKEKKDNLQLDNVSTLRMKVKNNQYFNYIAMYTMKIPTKDKNTP